MLNWFKAEKRRDFLRGCFETDASGVPTELKGAAAYAQARLAMVDPDLFLQQMIAAALGDRFVWQGVSRALRDGMVDFARRRSPFYQDRLGKVGRRFEDIPLLSKSEIRDAGATMLAQGIPQTRYYAYQTSGSSGDPMPFFVDRAWGGLVEASRKFFELLHRVPSGLPMVCVQTLVPDLPNVYPVLATGLTDSYIAEQVSKWDAWPEYWIRGYSSSIEQIAAVVERLGLMASPACVVTHADMLTDVGRELIARVFIL